MTAEELVQTIAAAPVETIQSMLECDPKLASSRGPNGVSALMLALYHRRRDVAELLRASLPTLDVFEAAALDRAHPLRELLEQDPALAHATSADGFTALGYAAYFGGRNAAQLLLEHGADPNAHALNSTKVAPLHGAVSAGNRDVAEILLAHGADPDARQEAGYTALMSAAHSGNEEIVQLLLGYGADPSLESEDGKDAALLAAAGGHPDLADRLRELRPG